MIYRVPQPWIERRRRMARFVPLFMTILAVVMLALVLVPRVDWSKPQDRRAAGIVTLVVVVGFGLASIAGRFAFTSTMRTWESFQVELTDDELIRQMNGQETRIQRPAVNSIREYPRRGFVVTDNLGWRIFVPRMVANYEDFRQRILTWGARSS
jgi:hypothetical protein